MKLSNELEAVTVGLGNRAYDICIGPGLLERAGEFLVPLLQRPRTIVVTDENVHAAQGARLKRGLDEANIAFESIVLPAGEATKSFDQLEALISKLLECGIERQDLIVAFGGGVVGDLTGFAASILRRGCRFAQIPTSLLAQVDSAVGGKTAINTEQGKNLVGAFHQPAIVLSDIGALATLPDRQLRAGYAEIVKYGLLGDAAFFSWLEKNGAALLGGDSNKQIYAIKKSCEAKAQIVADDEKEHGVRALLNLGHTFGHAFEAAYGYSDKLLHGEAVALGMALAFDYAAAHGICPSDDADRLRVHLKEASLPASTDEVPQNDELNADNLAALMMQDKKVEQGKLTLILPRKIGDAKIVRDASIQDVKSFLKEKTAQ